MTANRSTAVMQRRRVAPDSLDYFPTPPFATRALCEHLAGGFDLARQSAWEPACGEGHMAAPLAEYFGSVRASDVHNYGDHELVDFVVTGRTEPPVDWIITNPPFRLGEDFIATALGVAQFGVAMLVRTAFLEGDGREQRLFSATPPSLVLQFCERVVMLEGRLVRSGAVDPFNPQPGRKASSATSYCWLIWTRDRADPGQWLADTRLRWIPRCRHLLERHGDYPDYALQAAA